MSPVALALSRSPVVAAFSASCSANATRAPRPSTSAGSRAARVSCACALPAPPTTVASAAMTSARPRPRPDIRSSRCRLHTMVPRICNVASARLRCLRTVSEPHMSPDEFRRHGHEVVEWVASYMERVGEMPIASGVQPGEIRAKLPASAPEAPEPFEALLADLDEVVLPGITHWQAPGWFGYFPANVSPPSILAELVSAGLGAQGMIWSSSPALTEIEAHVLDWLVDLLGLPEHFKTAVGPGGGVIQMSASDSTHLVHVVARERAVEAGGPLDRLVAYGSSQAHSSVDRGAKLAGFGHVRKLDVDAAYALRADALREAIAEDRAAGLHPAIVTSAIGTTGTGAVDPITEVATIAGEHGLWHH